MESRLFEFAGKIVVTVKPNRAEGFVALAGRWPTFIGPKPRKTFGNHWNLNGKDQSKPDGKVV